jgi:hypothetical protein
MAKSAEKPSSPSSNPKQSTSSGSSSSRTSAATTTAGPPTEALMTLLSPDGYYTFLGIDKPEMQAGSSTKSTIDEDLVKKNYRKLSLKHHPDRPTGDAETFHALNRAHKVLLNQKLREQYDLLGLDLDDDVVDEEHEQEDDDDKKEKKPDGPTTAESIIAHIFSTALMSVMQLGVRTGEYFLDGALCFLEERLLTTCSNLTSLFVVMMGTVSVLVCRYWWTLTPALLLLGFVCFRMYTTMSTIKGSSILDLLSPCSIGLGLLLMFYGRSSSLGVSWSYMFWVGTTFK